MKSEGRQRDDEERMREATKKKKKSRNEVKYDLKPECDFSRSH